MSINKIYSDQSRRVDWTVREDTDATLTLTVTQSSAAYNLSSTTFICEIFEIDDLTTPLITLTQGDGLTNGGAAGTLVIALTDTQLNLTPNKYFWKLRTTAPTDYLWLNGIFIVNGYTWDGGTDYSVAIALTVANNEINIDLVAASVSGSVTLATLGTTLQTAAADTTLDADTWNFYDAVDAILKKITWANVKATLKTYFDTLYKTINSAEFIAIACSDETTVLAAASTSVPVAAFHAPYAMTLTRVFAGLTTAGTGAAVVTVDIHVNGTTIMTTTKILFTAGVKLSADGTLTTTALAAGDYVEIFLDQRDTNNVATGLKTYLVGYK